jgi:hypothetical protein
MLFKFALEYAIRKVYKNRGGTEIKLVYADDVSLLGDNINTQRKRKLYLTLVRRFI